MYKFLEMKKKKPFNVIFPSYNKTVLKVKWTNNYIHLS